jgi:hypothetical protein
MKIETLLASNAGGFLSGGSHRAGLILLQKEKHEDRNIANLTMMKK